MAFLPSKVPVNLVASILVHDEVGKDCAAFCRLGSIIIIRDIWCMVPNDAVDGYIVAINGMISIGQVYLRSVFSL
jgi:hypothetical protein